MDTENQERISEARKKASPTKRLGVLLPESAEVWLSMHICCNQSLDARRYITAGS